MSEEPPKKDQSFEKNEEKSKSEDTPQEIEDIG